MESSPEVWAACKNVYQRVNDFWQGCQLPNPCEVNQDTRLERDGLQVTYSRDIKLLDPPRIRDLEVPEELRQFLAKYGQSVGFGDKTFVDRSAFELALTLYGYWRTDLDGVSPKDDEYGLMPIKERYDEWFYPMWRDWWNQERWARPKVEILDERERSLATFSLSTKGKLVGLKISESSEQSYMWKSAALAFRGDQLISLRQIVPNGTFFPDPKGPRDEIWPSWFLPKPPLEHGQRRMYFADKIDWNRYMQRVREGRKVISGKTGKWVYQTTRQALESLERWRDRIYYLYPQGFYFRRSRLAPDGFKTEVGYWLNGRFGEYISRNPRSYRALDSSETARYLDSWDPETFLRNRS